VRISASRAAAALARGQVAATVLRVDDVDIRKQGGTTAAFDPALGYAPVTPNAPYYTGKAKIKPQVVHSAIQESAGQQITALGFIVSLPLSVTAVRPEDIITILASQDPANVGKKLRIASVKSSSTSTARRLVCLDYQETP
jgi:hypothetical protein